MSSLIRAVEVMPPGKWPAGTAVDRLVLNYDERHRRRLRYVAAGGTTFLLDLPRAVLLRAGDGLRLEDGRMVIVEASPEQLVEITAPNAAALIRLAWHIGNRHLPAQLEPQRILIREDAVIENMLRGLGAHIKHVLEPFTPEAGAYDSAAGGVAPQAHGHSHPYSHPHEQDHSHGHEHSHTHPKGGRHHHD